MTRHQVVPAEQISHPGGKDGMFRAACVCGGYWTGPYATAAKAEKTAQQHVDAKNNALVEDDHG